MDYTRWPDSQPLPNPNHPPHDSYAQYYNQTHQHPLYHPSSSSSSYYPSHQSSTPNAMASHHVAPSAQTFGSPPHTALAPPGAESYAGLSTYHPPHVSYSGAGAHSSQGYAPVGALSTTAAYYQDPVAPQYQDPIGTQSWAVKEAIRQYGADPVAYAAAIESLNKESMLPSIPSNGISQPIMNAFNKKTKAVQSFWCDVCNLECTSNDVYDRHLYGKKHKTNLTERLNKGSILPASASNPFGPSTLLVGEDLETKRWKLMKGGASVDSVMVCTLCNVVCNSQDVYQKHLAGRKHALQAGSIPQNGLVHPGAANPVPGYWTNPVVPRPVTSAMKRGGAPKKRKIVQSAWCEVCKVDCTSKEVLDSHKSGKKHKRQVEKVEEEKAAKANPSAAQKAKKPVIGPQENPSAEKGKSKKKRATIPEEDLETKKRKILEGGAAEGAVRVCQVCNVVCNSDVVYNYHLAGQKHAANAKKNEAGGAAPSAAPLAITAA